MLTLEASNAGVVEWWIDGAFSNHSDMQSHTGGCLSLGKGMVTSKSMYQKLNTHSSTKAELVTVDDCLPPSSVDPLLLDLPRLFNWGNHYTSRKAENGNWSSSQWTHHLNVRYYSVTDKITKDEIQIDHCGSSHMIVDYFTKPLQGSLFKNIQDLVLNVSAGSTPADPKQCVGP